MVAMRLILGRISRLSRGRHRLPPSGFGRARELTLQRRLPLKKSPTKDTKMADSTKALVFLNQNLVKCLKSHCFSQFVQNFG